VETPYRTTTALDAVALNHQEENMNRPSRTGRRPAKRPWPLRAAGLLLLLVVPALALAACGSSSSGSSGSSSSASGSDASASSTTSSGGASDASGGGTAANWCGDKEITLGIQDGGGTNGWSKESLAQVQQEARTCPNIKRTIVVNAGFDLQRAISGLNSLVAQGANAIVIIPDAGGPAELPGIRNATRHGAKVVPWGSDPGGGTPGTDYVAYVDWDARAAGETWGEWMARELDGRGNVIFLGGPAGNAVDRGSLSGALDAFSRYPGIRMLTGDRPAVANWDPAQTQKVTAGLLTQYPQIDGIIVADGQSGAGAIRAFQAAGRRIPPIATLEANEIACLWRRDGGENGGFPLATISARNWLGRYAVRDAVGAVNGVDPGTKSLVSLPLYENSDGGKQPECRPDAAPDSFFSNEQSDAQLDKLMANGG
jgi:ribose transport system substrate-binding protein